MNFDQYKDINQYINFLCLEGEEWRDIDCYDGYYQISNYGRIKSLPRVINCKNGATRIKPEKILKLSQDSDGYYITGLCVNGIRKNCKPHRLVAETFISNPNNYLMINHKDEIKTNNCVWNLEWCDVLYNNNYGTKRQRMSETMSLNPKAHRYGADNPFYGKHHSNETKSKLSELNKGRNKGSDNVRAIKVLQFTLEGEYIKTYGSISEAALDNNLRPDGHISTCINGKTNQCGGYIWIKESEYSLDLLQEKVYKIKRPKKRNVEIYQFDKQDNYINKYNSITEAAITTGVQSSDITSCARGKLKTAGGYIWKYKNEGEQ